MSSWWPISVSICRSLDGLISVRLFAQAGEPSQRSEAVVAARPMRAHGVETGVAHHAAQHDGDDDGVVGVAQHRNEVGNGVDRYRQIDQQQYQSHADTS